MRLWPKQVVYHEAGKIMGKNYIEGLKLADEYVFLKLNCTRQHNIKHDKPTFIESAIVMPII